MTTATPAPAMPRRGNGPQPQISAGESTRRSGPPATTTTAGSRMLPAPRRTLPSVLKSQNAPAPAKTTLEYVSAAASAPSVPPIARERGAPEPADVPRLEDGDGRLDGDDDDVGRGQPQERAGNRRLEEHASARGEAPDGGRRRGDRGDAERVRGAGHDLLNTSD